jgi:pimeloyl-ACP methyl ester carboxylesterase
MPMHRGQAATRHPQRFVKVLLVGPPPPVEESLVDKRPEGQDSSPRCPLYIKPAVLDLVP